MDILCTTKWLLTFSNSFNLSRKESSSGIGESEFVCCVANGGNEVGSPPDSTGTGIPLAAALTAPPRVAATTAGGGSLEARSFDIGDCGLAAMGGRARSDFFRGVVISAD